MKELFKCAGIALLGFIVTAIVLGGYGLVAWGIIHLFGFYGVFIFLSLIAFIMTCFGVYQVRNLNRSLYPEKFS